MTFAFGAEDMVLTTIGEDEEAVEEVSGDHVKESKLATATLAAAAEKELKDLSRLLGKLNTGTATRNEKDRVLSLNANLSKLKKEIEVSKERETVSEMKMLHSATRTKVTQIQTALKEKDIRSAVRAVCAAESVDLAFIVDCTGSMTSYIASVKQNMIDIVRRISQTSGNLSLRMAMVGYRGVRDMHHPSNLSILDFVSSVHDFEDFLGRISTWGGDGYTADMARGIQKANQLSWKQSTRVAFLIADVPCHGSEFHPRSDNYPNGTPGVDIKAELKTMFANSESGTMTVNFGRITVETDQMIRRFKECGIPIEVVGIEDISKVAGSVARSVRKSIFNTMTVSGGGGKSVAFAPVADVESLLRSKSGMSTSAVSLKDYRIHAQVPTANDWMKRKAVSVKVYRNQPIKSVANLQAPIGIGILQFSRGRTDATKASTMYMRRAADPFAEGEIRIAYHSQLSRRKDGLHDNAKSAMVMKSFKHVGKGLNDRTQYLKQMEVSTIADFLANEYSGSAYRPSHCARIRVLTVAVVEEEDEKNEKNGNRRFCAEECLPADGTAFTKFSNNTGFWDEDHLDESLLRFTSFTHKISKGYLMVTDLQGIRKGREFILTDPVILCKDVLRFGNTNLGEKFMQKFVDTTRAFMKEKGWR
jgi:hypothetical protein